jgi:Sulfotransferase family
MVSVGYRKLMDHWDRALPGRIVHIKYEDLVRDTAVLTKAIIGATGLDWHDEILDFHKKKQAVNTLSTTQVRKGIYTDSLQAWRKYETQLQPLVTMIGEYMEYPLKTTVPGYSPPSSSSSSPPPHPPNSMDEEAKET